MNNNNNPQTPPSANQVPDQRLEQIMSQMRQLELQNSQLRGQVDQMARQANPSAQKPPKEPAFKPEVQQAIDDAIEAKLSVERNNHRQQVGWLADQLDEAKFQANYGGEKYAKFIPKVEQLRQEYQARNQYITRDQALQMVHWEETGRKGLAPDPAAQPEVKPPVFDRYMMQWVDPATGQPVVPNAVGTEPAQEFQPQPAAQAWQSQAQMNPPQAPEWGTTPPGTRMPAGAQHPNGNAYGQNFQLPGQGVNNPSPASRQPAQVGPMTLDASDSQLEAFEQKYGDIPL